MSLFHKNMWLRFIVDENVRREVAEFLISEKHDVIRPPAGSLDEDVAEIARKEARILLTHDLDFANIFQYPPESYAGIIVIRILPPLVKTIIFALAQLLKTLRSREFSGKLIILGAGGFRIREE